MQPAPRPDPVVEAYKAGVDRTLLVQNLRRSPTERLLAMMSMLHLVEEMRRAMTARNSGRAR